MAYHLKILVFFGSILNEYNINGFSTDAPVRFLGSAYGTNADVDLPIIFKENHWVIESNPAITFYEEEQVLSEAVIKSGVVYKAKITDVERSLYLLCLKMDDDTIRFNRYVMPSGKEISIGSVIESDIRYKNAGVSKLHAKMHCEETGEVILKCIKAGRIFINGMATQSDIVPLKFGDEINIMGLKIIILGRIFLMNNPENRVTCSCEQAKQYLPEIGMPLKEKKRGYFTKTPRLIKHYKNGQIEIEAPPAPFQQKNLPLILMIGPSVTMAMAMIVSLGVTIYAATSREDGVFNTTSIVTSGTMAFSMLLGAIFWPMILNWYQKKMTEKEEAKRIEQYKRYIEETDLKLSGNSAWNKKIALDIHPDPCRVISRCVINSRKTWERTSHDEDFLDVRIGLGEQKNTIDISVPKERFSLVDDPLKDEPKSLFEKYERVANMPMTIPLVKDIVVGIVGKKNQRYRIVQNLLIQLAGLHSYEELKLVFICNTFQKQEFQWIKLLPHVWSADRSIRFFASNKEEAHAILNHLDGIVREREDTIRDGHSKQMAIPYFVVFVMDDALLDEEPAVRYLSDAKNKLSISSVFVGEGMEALPSDCQTIIHYDDEACEIFSKKRKELGEALFIADEIPKLEIEKFTRSISQFKLKSLPSEQSIPEGLDFLSMFKVGRIEQLLIEKRWHESTPHKTLETPIGVKGGGAIFSLNIHEKDHGSHGLVAGMTGSGKSEFIQAYILSMAINYHPHDVSFILIDYKGGGMANCFNGLPHIAGVITNLGGNQINRSLISINAELRRRQKIFEAAGVNNINSYEMLYKENKRHNFTLDNHAIEPLPHLVIISDEFAELKRQQPEFMEKLVSAACIGRSLGVHLILATQKPSGVVDDQIWSNSRFRVCLKVLDRQDSQEMLKRPEAAMIKSAGRAYVQVGYNEIFEHVQTGYSGAKYIPEDDYFEPEAQKITLIDNSASLLKSLSSLKPQNEEADKTQLEAVVDYLCRFSKVNGIEKINIWPEQLPEIISLTSFEMFNRSTFNGEQWPAQIDWMNPIIGVYDDPENQEQNPLKIDISKNGHIVIYGMPGTGKTTFVISLLYSIVKTYSPEDVLLHVLDFGGRSLGFIGDLPHCLGVAYAEDESQVEQTFERVIQELSQRKNLFASHGVSNINAYKKTTEEKIPAVMLVIDSCSVFRERYGHIEDKLVTIAREGSNYGIYLILTGSDKSAVYYKVTDYVKQFITLQMADKSDYMEIHGTRICPEPFKGRGITKLHAPLEFQTALPVNEIDEAERTRKLVTEFKQMSVVWSASVLQSPVRATTTPMIQDHKEAEHVSDARTSNEFQFVSNIRKNLQPDSIITAFEADHMPLGWHPTKNTVGVFNLEKVNSFYIGGTEKTGKSNLIRNMAKNLKKHTDYKVFIFDALRESSVFYKSIHVDGFMAGGGDFDSLLTSLMPEMNSRIKERNTFRSQMNESDGEYEHMKLFGKIFILIDGFDEFYKLISDESVKRINKLFKIGLQGLNFYFITAEQPEKLAHYLSQDILYNLIRTQSGILMGGKVHQQAIISFDEMPAEDRTAHLELGQGFLFNENKYLLVTTPLEE